MPSTSTSTSPPDSVVAKKRHFLRESVYDICGGVSRGIALVLVGHPLDTIKVRLQTHSSGNSFMEVVKHIIQKEGISKFYKGSGPPLYTSAIFSAYYLWLYGSMKKLVVGESADVSPTFLQMSTVGVLCGFGSSFINSPVELVKCKLQVSGKVYKNTFSCVRAIYTRHGLQGLGQGYTATLARNTVGDIGYYGGYELSKFRLTKSLGKFWGTLIGGGIGGMAFWTTIYPLDVIKSRLQTQPFPLAERSYDGIADCARKIYASEGWRGFWKGYSVCLARSFPTNAAGFFVYEFTKEWTRTLF